MCVWKGCETYTWAYAFKKHARRTLACAFKMYPNARALLKWTPKLDLMQWRILVAGKSAASVYMTNIKPCKQTQELSMKDDSSPAHAPCSKPNWTELIQRVRWPYLVGQPSCQGNFFPASKVYSIRKVSREGRVERRQTDPWQLSESKGQAHQPVPSLPPSRCYACHATIKKHCVTRLRMATREINNYY